MKACERPIDGKSGIQLSTKEGSYGVAGLID